LSDNIWNNFNVEPQLCNLNPSPVALKYKHAINPNKIKAQQLHLYIKPVKGNMFRSVNRARQPNYELRHQWKLGCQLAW